MIRLWCRCDRRCGPEDTTRCRGVCRPLALLMQLALLYMAWMVCRVVFYIQNQAEIGGLAGNEVGGLLHGAWIFDTVSILYVNSLFIVLSLFPFRIRERKWYSRMLRWLFAVTNSAALVLNIADGVYFHYAKKRFTSDELSYLSNNDNTGSVLFKAMGENWYILLFAAVLITALLWGYRQIRIKPSRIQSNVCYFLVHFPILLVAVGGAVAGMRGGFSRQTRPITLSNATLYTASSLKANLILSNPFCMLRTLGNRSVSYTKFFDQSTLDSLYTPYHVPSATDSLTPNNRNVVLFILESFSSEHSALLNPDLYPDGRGYTPCLDSLMREGYYFEHAFSNGRKSIEALPSVLSSIPSYRTPFVLMPQALAPMESLPMLLAKEGYNTSFFNGSGYGSMGFGAYASLAGVAHYYSREDYEKRRGTNDFDGYWGIWDEPFLQYMNQVLSETPQPFFASVFTLSSHHPFVVPEKYRTQLPEGTTKIHKGIGYTDLALCQFMQQASREPWFHNTIFVFVADHVSSETFAPKTRTPTGSSQIISFLYTPDGSLRGVDRSISQQIDLMPTLLGVLGYDKPYFAFGRDVLREEVYPPLVVNFMNETYQAITDSLVLFFDGERTMSAYLRSDTLQQHDISSRRTPLLETTEHSLKAHLQQYYQHVEKGDYLVK